MTKVGRRKVTLSDRQIAHLIFFVRYFVSNRDEFLGLMESSLCLGDSRMRWTTMSEEEADQFASCLEDLKESDGVHDVNLSELS